jgi:hypothetical protein
MHICTGLTVLNLSLDKRGTVHRPPSRALRIAI